MSVEKELRYDCDYENQVKVSFTYQNKTMNGITQLSHSRSLPRNSYKRALCGLKYSTKYALVCEAIFGVESFALYPVLLGTLYFLYSLLVSISAHGAPRNSSVGLT